MNVNLNLTIDETNVVLASLAKQPYENVADTIGKIRNQAITQVNGTAVQEETVASNQLLTED